MTIKINCSITDNFYVLYRNGLVSRLLFYYTHSTVSIDRFEQGLADYVNRGDKNLFVYLGNYQQLI